MDEDHTVAVDLLGNGQQVLSGPRAAVSLKGIRANWRSSRKFWLLLVVTLLQLNFAQACVDISKRTGSKPGIPIPDSAFNEQLLALQLNSPWHDSAVGASQVCNTKECVNAAYKLLFGINRAADPCHDFHDFACGNWDKLYKFRGLAYNNNTQRTGISHHTFVEEILLRPAESYDCFQAMKTASVFFQQCVNASESDCLRRTINFFAVPIMHEYLKTISNVEALTVLDQMIAKTVATFSKVLEKNVWLSEAGKSTAQNKLSALKTFIGYPNWLLNTTEIESSFEMIQLGSNFSETLASIINTRESNLNLSSKGEISNDPSINFYVLPMSIMQSHGFHINMPSYVSYGRIGAVIGHDISRDFKRRNLDEKTQSKDQSWTDEDKQNYEEKSNCYVDQFNKFEILSGIYVNGTTCLDENIADNTGMKIAYLTYKEHYARDGNGYQRLPGFEKLSVERLFLLSYGSLWCENEDVATLTHRALVDPHIPGKYRTNGVLQNSPEFADAWNCPLGSPMNPINKCTLW